MFKKFINYFLIFTLILSFNFNVKAENKINGYEKVTENSYLELYYNKKDLSIIIKDKKTNIQYKSFSEIEEGLNDIYKAFMKSAITIEYANKDNKIVRLPLSTSNANIDTQILENGFKSNISYKEGFSFEFSVLLEEDNLKVGILGDSIKEENKDNKLQKIYIYPFFEATYGTNVNGYMFVPDGSGALIRTNEKTLATQPYIKRLYGDDIAIKNNFNSKTLEPEQIYIPVYAMISEENKKGLVTIIEKGDEYSEIEAVASSISINHNYITSRFILRDTYFQSLSKQGNKISMIQENINKTDILLTYSFLNGNNANYQGVANIFKNFLIKKDIFNKKEEKQENIPLNLDFLASERKKQLIGYKSIPMTKISDIDKILESFIKQNINNLKVNIRGYAKEGSSTSFPSEIELNNKIGSKSEFKHLLEKYKTKNIDISLYTDFIKGNEENSVFSKTKDVVQCINREILINHSFSNFYYLSNNFISNHIKENLKEAKNLGVENLTLDTIGYRLYSNYNKSNVATRTETKQFFKDLNFDNINISFYSPNYFLWAKTKEIYNLPKSSSGYLIFTEDIPFLQLVLKGYIPYYNKPFNFNANPKEDLLKTIEYGAYPSYYLTKEEPYKLIDTASEWLYSSKFEVLEKEIISNYNEINNILREVIGEEIIEHKKIDKNVVFVLYSNGYKIYINYNDYVYEKNNIKIEPLSYYIEKKGDMK